MYEIDHWHLAAALGDLDAVTDQDAPAVDAQRLGEQPQHHLAPQLCEPVELHGGAVEAIEEGIVAPSVELQRAHNAGYAQQPATAVANHRKVCRRENSGPTRQIEFDPCIHSDIGPPCFSSNSTVFIYLLPMSLGLIF